MTDRLPAVLFNELHPSRFKGGEELVQRQILLGLAARGWRCLLAYHEFGDLIPEYEAAGIQCRRFDLSPARSPAPGAFMKSVAGQALWARSEGVSLHHCNSYFRSSHAGVVKSLGGFPAVCHFHLPPPHYLSRQYRWGLRRLDGYIAVSGYTAAEWTQALGAPQGFIQVLHNPIDIDRFRPDEEARALARREIAASENCVVIGYCGRLVREKGVDVLLRALAQLVAEKRPVKLVVVGGDAQNVALYGDPLRPKLELLAQKLGVASSIIFLGVRQDVERWYNAMDIVVVPSTWSEPFGLSVAEGLACGRPVVASRVGGVPEILGGPLDELLVPPGAADALAAILLRLIDNPQRRSEFGGRGREIVEQKFRVSLFVDRIEEIFQRTLKWAPRGGQGSGH